MRRQDLELSAAIVVQMMAGRAGVKLHFNAPGGASTTFSDIFLPPLSEDSSKARVLLLGDVGHESAHIRFTDPAVIGSVPAAETRRKNLLNVLEDIRMEPLQMAEFPGYRMYCNDSLRIIQEDGHGFKVNPENSWSIFEGYCLGRGYVDHAKIPAASTLANEAEALFDEKLPKGLKVRTDALLGEIRRCKNTADCLVLADKLLLAIDEEAKKEEPKPPPPTPPKKAPGKPGKPSEKPGDSPESGGSRKNPGAAPSAQSLQSDANAESVKGLSEALANALDKESAGAMAAGQVMMDPLPHQVVAARRAPKALADVRAVSTRSRLRLKTKLLNLSRSQQWYCDRGKRMLPSRLHRLARRDMRVYQRVREGLSHECAVHTMLDGSSSMGSKMQLANSAALALADALDGIKGVNSCVTTFPKGHIVKPFGGKVSSYAGTISDVTASGGTPLSEAILGSAHMLLMRPEPRKILAVVSDGKPNNIETAKALLASLAAQGVDIVGVGIGVDIRDLIPASEMISTIEELPQALFAAITSRFIRPN